MNSASVAVRCLGTAATVFTVASMCAACAGTSASAARETRLPAAWHLAALGMPSTPSTVLGHRELIAVLDTGLDDADLPALAGRVVSPWDQIQQVPTAFDDNGHGTEMAVIIAGGGDRGVWGLAPGANVMPIKVADQDGRAMPEAVANGISRAVALHASVINLSLATQVWDPGIARAVASAIASGAVVVASAGDANEAGPEFPASEPGVVAVYAQDSTGAVAAHYNQPVGPAVMAPGVEVTTLAPVPGGVAVRSISGSSVAAAIVSGLLADCLSALETAGGQPGRAVATCKSRVVRDPGVPGFIRLRSVTAPA